MLDLDFTFFNQSNRDLMGLARKKFLLDRLAPLFFGPRLEKLIYLSPFNLKGGNVLLPIGPGNLKALERSKQMLMIEKSLLCAQRCQVNHRAVDRRLKKQVKECTSDHQIIYGDEFIKALASVLVREMISKRGIEKLVILGETENFAAFLEHMSDYKLPISLQSFNPARYEVFTYRLLYDKGCAICTSYINPNNWEKGDLVIIFDRNLQRFSMGLPGVFCVRLIDESKGLAPELEHMLVTNGLEPNLYNLAPLLETCLKAWSNLEQNKSSYRTGANFVYYRELGDDIGLWDLFLDNAL